MACAKKNRVELAWRSGSVMDCHAMARGSISGGNSVLTFARDSKWGCRLYMTSLSMGRKTQPTKKSRQSPITTYSVSHVNMKFRYRTGEMID